MSRVKVQATEPKFGIQIGERFLHTHSPDKCEGRHCVIHNPSDHPLKDAPLNWRADRGLMERLCPHNIGHPDPDDLDYKEMTYGEEFAWGESIHGCDGCC